MDASTTILPPLRYIVNTWGGVRSKSLLALIERGKIDPKAKATLCHHRDIPRTLEGDDLEKGWCGRIPRSEAGRVIVVFAFREVAESVASRLGRAHCRHLRGNNCMEFPLQGWAPGVNITESIEWYTKRGKDDLRLQDFWDKHQPGAPHEYPIVYLHTRDLFNATRFPHIRRALHLKDTVQPLEFKRDHLSRHTDSPSLRSLRNMYAKLEADIEKFAVQQYNEAL